MFKKLSLILLLFLTVAIVPPTSTAQVFMLEGSENNRESTPIAALGDGSWGNLTPTDPYVGLGSGLMVLTLAGTAYACARRKKAKNHSERTGASKLS